jgi:hypothetical protein
MIAVLKCNAKILWQGCNASKQPGPGNRIAGDPGGIISAGKMIIPGAGHTDIL